MNNLQIFTCYVTKSSEERSGCSHTLPRSDDLVCHILIKKLCQLSQKEKFSSSSKVRQRQRRSRSIWEKNILFAHRWVTCATSQNQTKKPSTSKAVLYSTTRSPRAKIRWSGSCRNSPKRRGPSFSPPTPTVRVRQSPGILRASSA